MWPFRLILEKIADVWGHIWTEDGPKCCILPQGLASTSSRRLAVELAVPNLRRTSQEEQRVGLKNGLVVRDLRGRWQHRHSGNNRSSKQNKPAWNVCRLKVTSLICSYNKNNVTKVPGRIRVVLQEDLPLWLPPLCLLREGSGYFKQLLSGRLRWDKKFKISKFPPEENSETPGVRFYLPTGCVFTNLIKCCLNPSKQ